MAGRGGHTDGEVVGVADSDMVTELTEELRQMKIRIAGIYASDNGQPSDQAAVKTIAN